MKSGIFTTEFWSTIIHYAIAALVVFGFIDRPNYEPADVAGQKILGGVAAIVTNALIVWKYIHSRHKLKEGGTMRVFIIAAVAVGFMGSALQAEALLPWRRQMEQRLNQLHQQNQPSTPAPIIIHAPAPAQPPLQILPIQGPNQQSLPIAGPIRQELPIQGAPRQELPTPGTPKQQLDPKGRPRQELPIQGPPAPNADGPQRLSVFALWRPGRQSN
jgi:hypothetical protein